MRSVRRDARGVHRRSGALQGGQEMRSTTAARNDMRVAIAAASLAAMVGAAVLHVSAQTRPESLKGIERLEGDWVRTDPNGSGEFGGLTSTFTPASLTPEATAQMQEGRRQAAIPRGPAYTEEKPHAVGQPYIVVQKPCAPGPFGSGGALGVNPDSGAIHFVISKNEIILAPERGG